MMAWLDRALWCLDRQQPVVLVTVVSVRGSAPREIGARMLVSPGRQWLTIGGGRLEWVAMARARTQLQDDQAPDRHVLQVPLAASLGQCCGGMVHLLFERLRETDRAWLQDARDRLARLESFEREVVLQDVRGGTVFTDVLAPHGPQVVVFGAGHVGQALVRILQTLPCRVTWVDARDDLFPDDVPEHVQIEATDIPEAVIDETPAGGYFLIMTHDHGLDQRLCEYLMGRNDFAYCGLIGSATKWRRFQQRFLAKGIAPERLQRMTCPIGAPGIVGKQPEVIAVAVAAQLLHLWAKETP